MRAQLVMPLVHNPLLLPPPLPTIFQRPLSHSTTLVSSPAATIPTETPHRES